MAQIDSHVGRATEVNGEESSSLLSYPVEDLLSWVSDLLGLDVRSLAQFQNGALFCLIVDAFHNCAADLTQVSILGHKNKDVTQNFSCLSDALSYIGANEVDSLALQHSFAKQLELLRWLHLHFEGRLSPSPSALAERRRLLCFDGGPAGSSSPKPFHRNLKSPHADEENQGDTANVAANIPPTSQVSELDEFCVTPLSLLKQNRQMAAAPFTDSPHDYSRLRQSTSDTRTPPLSRLSQWTQAQTPRSHPEDDDSVNPHGSGSTGEEQPPRPRTAGNYGSTSIGSVTPRTRSGLKTPRGLSAGRRDVQAPSQSDADLSASDASSRRPALTHGWNASSRVEASMLTTPRQGRGRNGPRRSTPKAQKRPGVTEADALGMAMPKPLTPSRTKKLRASDRIVEAAEEAARQAVSVSLQSMPKLRRMLRDVGCCPRDGYEHMARLKTHRDATKGILEHTWDLLEDVLQLAILHGGIVGRTRSRHMETLMKELTAAEGIFADICNEIEKAEKFFPVPETAQAYLDASAAAAAGRGETDTRQHDAVLRSVSQAQAYMGSIFSQLGPVTRWSDCPRDAQAVRQHVITSSTWPAAMSIHSGSDADDDTSSVGGWSDAASGYSDASTLRTRTDPIKGQRHAMWQDRGLALSAALSNILPGDQADGEQTQTSQGHHGPSEADDSDNNSQRLQTLATAIINVRKGSASRYPEELRDATVPLPANEMASQTEARQSLIDLEAEGHDENNLTPVTNMEAVTTPAFLEEFSRDLPAKRQAMSKNPNMVVDVGPFPVQRNALRQPSEVPGLGDVISPVYRMAECFAEMERGRGDAPHEPSQDSRSTSGASARSTSPSDHPDSAAVSQARADSDPTRRSADLHSTQTFLSVHRMDLPSPVDDFLGTEFWESMVTKDLLHSPGARNPSPLKASLFLSHTSGGQEALMESGGSQDALAPPAMLASFSDLLSTNNVLLLSQEFGEGTAAADADAAANWLQSSSLDCTSVKLGFQATALTNASILTSHPLSDDEMFSPAPTRPSTGECSMVQTPVSGVPRQTAGSPEIDGLLRTPQGTAVSGNEGSTDHASMTTPRNHPNHIAEPLLVTCAVHSPMSVGNSPAQAPASLLTRGVFSPNTGTWQAAEGSVTTASSAMSPLGITPLPSLANEGTSGTDLPARHVKLNSPEQTLEFDKDPPDCAAEDTSTGSTLLSSKESLNTSTASRVSSNDIGPYQGGLAESPLVFPAGSTPQQRRQMIPKLALPIVFADAKAGADGEAGAVEWSQHTTGTIALNALRNAWTPAKSLDPQLPLPEPNHTLSLAPPEVGQAHLSEACERGLPVVAVRTDEVREMELPAQELPETNAEQTDDHQPGLSHPQIVAPPNGAAPDTEVFPEDDESSAPTSPGRDPADPLANDGVANSGSTTPDIVVSGTHVPEQIAQVAPCSSSVEADACSVAGPSDHQLNCEGSEASEADPLEKTPDSNHLDAATDTSDTNGVIHDSVSKPSGAPQSKSGGTDSPVVDEEGLTNVSPNDVTPSVSLDAKVDSETSEEAVAEEAMDGIPLSESSCKDDIGFPEPSSDVPTPEQVATLTETECGEQSPGPEEPTGLPSTIVVHPECVDLSSPDSIVTGGVVPLEGQVDQALEASPRSPAAGESGVTSPVALVGRPLPGAGPWASPSTKLASVSPASTHASRGGSSPASCNAYPRTSPASAGESPRSDDSREPVKLVVKAVGNQLAVKLQALSSALPELSGHRSAPPSPMEHPASRGRGSTACKAGDPFARAGSPNPQVSSMLDGGEKPPSSPLLQERERSVPLSPSRRRAPGPTGNTTEHGVNSPVRNSSPRKPTMANPARGMQHEEDPEAGLPKSQRAAAIERLLAKSSFVDFVGKGDQALKANQEIQRDVESPQHRATGMPNTGFAAEGTPTTDSASPGSESSGKVEEAHSAINVVSSGPINFSGPINIILSSHNDAHAASQPGQSPDTVPNSGGSTTQPLRVDQISQTSPRDEDLFTLQGLISRANSALQMQGKGEAPCPAVHEEPSVSERPAPKVTEATTEISPLSSTPGPSGSGRRPTVPPIIPKLRTVDATPVDEVPKPRRLSIFRRKGQSDRTSRDTSSAVPNRRMLFRPRAAAGEGVASAQPSPREVDADLAAVRHATSSFFRWGKKLQEGRAGTATDTAQIATPRRMSGLIRALRRPEGPTADGLATPRRTSLLGACAGGLPDREEEPTAAVRGGTPLATPRGTSMLGRLLGRPVPVTGVREGNKGLQAATSAAALLHKLPLHAPAAAEARTDGDRPLMATASNASTLSQGTDSTSVVVDEPRPAASSTGPDTRAGRALVPAFPKGAISQRAAPTNMITPRADVLAVPPAPALMHPMTSRPRSGASEERRRCNRFLNADDAVYEEHVLDYGDRYKGMLVGDAKHGDGAYYFANGDVYEGEFKNDSMCGLGCYIFAGDGRYEGQWEDAVYSGTGMETFAKGSTYHGGYFDGARHGWGVCRYYNGDYYEGEWRAGLRHGRGMQLCTDSSTYVGDYRRGKRDGFGAYSFPNGDRYLGQYKADLPHGQGVYYFATGQIYEGLWEAGKKSGWCVYTVETGTQWAGEWVAGQPKWVAPLEVDAAGDPRDGRGEAVAQAMDAARLARGAGLRCASFAREYAKVDGDMQVQLAGAIQQARGAAAAARGARLRASRLIASMEQELAQQDGARAGA